VPTPQKQYARKNQFVDSGEFLSLGSQQLHNTVSQHQHGALGPPLHRSGSGLDYQFAMGSEKISHYNVQEASHKPLRLDPLLHGGAHNRPPLASKAFNHADRENDELLSRVHHGRVSNTEKIEAQKIARHAGS
jgi:hypothetical protein